jgi:hypothetical protein
VRGIEEKINKEVEARRKHRIYKKINKKKYNITKRRKKVLNKKTRKERKK